MNGNRYEVDGPVEAGAFSGYAEGSAAADHQRRKSLHHRTAGPLTATEASRPIVSAMNSMHEQSSELLQTIDDLTDRLSGVLHSPQPEKADGNCRPTPVSVCGLHDEMLSVSRRLDDAIGRVNRLMARLAL